MTAAHPHTPFQCECPPGATRAPGTSEVNQSVAVHPVFCHASVYSGMSPRIGAPKTTSTGDWRETAHYIPRVANKLFLLGRDRELVFCRHHICWQSLLTRIHAECYHSWVFLSKYNIADFEVNISSAESKKVVSDIFGKIEFLMEYENIGKYVHFALFSRFLALLFSKILSKMC